MGRATGRTRHSWTAPTSRSLVVSLHLHCRRASAENLSCLEIRLPSRSIDSIICARSGWSRQVFDRSFRCSSRGQGKSLSHMRHVCIPTIPPMQGVICRVSFYPRDLSRARKSRKQRILKRQELLQCTNYLIEQQQSLYCH